MTQNTAYFLTAYCQLSELLEQCSSFKRTMKRKTGDLKRERNGNEIVNIDVHTSKISVRKQIQAGLEKQEPRHVLELLPRFLSS